MRYGEFAAAIGLGEKWQPWHRQQIADILNLIAAAEQQAGDNTDVEPLQFNRIVTAKGVPGEGIKKPRPPFSRYGRVGPPARVALGAGMTDRPLGYSTGLDHSGLPESANAEEKLRRAIMHEIKPHRRRA
jgi:hypothetical protein